MEILRFAAAARWAGASRQHCAPDEELRKSGCLEWLVREVAVLLLQQLQLSSEHPTMDHSTPLVSETMPSSAQTLIPTTTVATPAPPVSTASPTTTVPEVIMTFALTYSTTTTTTTTTSPVVDMSGSAAPSRLMPCSISEMKTRRRTTRRSTLLRPSSLQAWSTSVQAQHRAHHMHRERHDPCAYHGCHTGRPSDCASTLDPAGASLVINRPFFGTECRLTRSQAGSSDAQTISTEL